MDFRERQLCAIAEALRVIDNFPFCLYITRSILRRGENDTWMVTVDNLRTFFRACKVYRRSGESWIDRSCRVEICDGVRVLDLCFTGIFSKELMNNLRCLSDFNALFFLSILWLFPEHVYAVMMRGQRWCRASGISGVMVTT